MAQPESLLVVCTANVCRSPLAERALRAELAADPFTGARVVSAWTRALVGSGPCRVAAALGPGAAEAEGHVAQQVRLDLVREAALVLTMEREHRGEVVRTAPGSQSKVFTLREAVALSGLLVEHDRRVEGSLAAVARALHGVRGLAPLQVAPRRSRRWLRRPAEPQDPLTIADGHGLDPDRHGEALEEVLVSVLDLLNGLRAVS